MSWPDVDNPPSFPDLDRDVRERWEERDVFAESLRRREGGPIFSFYEGPPTANGHPGTHHIESRVFKDIFPRYRTMKGFQVPRKGGWDCHGLPVELEIERELGLNSKADIEEFGIEEFNRRCRESVTRYVDEWEEFTDRVGFWVDLDDAYRTMDAAYVDSVWWALKQLWDDGLVFEDYRVAPYCGRCGTALSDAEVAQGYATTTDPSVYVRLPVLDGPLAERDAALLVWTTTPWTLPSNTAVVVGPGIDYVLAHPADDETDLLVLAAARVPEVLGDDAVVVEEVDAGDLVDLHYRAPFEFVAVDVDYRYVTAGEFATEDEGTGLVHVAPAFGAEDLEIGQREGLPVVNPVDADGRFAAGPWEGRFVKDADADIIAAMDDAGVLASSGTYEHTYPFCWRCDTPLIYYATPSWYIATTERREELLAANDKIDWHPEHIRDGRFGNWLENNVDWALSRERYWGTPLPFWRCDADHVTVVASRDELGELAGEDLSDLDPHRPYVDAVTFACPDCGRPAQRVPEVADAWFDSGAMPFAQFGYPHADGSGDEDGFAALFPADFIAEALDQTRGWFYTLLAESTLLFGESSYRTVLCLGLLVDEDSRKMSKSVGNVLDPWELLDRHGADAVRWLMLTEGNPWVNRRVGHHVLDDITRRFLLTLWNVHYFFTTYAELDGFSLDDRPPAVEDRHVMDRWVLAELADTIETVDTALERYDTSEAGRRLETFVGDLSNWYVRRNRRRFWKAADEDPADKAAAYHTLHSALVSLAGLLAPFVPFVADELYEDLVVSQRPDAAASVHLTDFPVAERDWRDDDLRDAMATARRVVELGRQARNESQLKVRQPLGRALVTVPESERSGLTRLIGEVADELNVKEIQIADASTELSDRQLKPNFAALGPTFESDAPTVAAAIEDLDASGVNELLTDLSAGHATVIAGGEERAVTPEMVEVVETPKTGWHLVSQGSTSFALDLEIDEDLRIEGYLRELVRAVNELRRQADLDLDERITLGVTIDTADYAAAFEEAGWFDVLAREALADELVRDTSGDATSVELDDDVSARVEIR